jgi:hypothetical protein
MIICYSSKWETDAFTVNKKIRIGLQMKTHIIMLIKHNTEGFHKMKNVRWAMIASVLMNWSKVSALTKGKEATGMAWRNKSDSQQNAVIIKTLIKVNDRSSKSRWYD